MLETYIDIDGMYGQDLLFELVEITDSRDRMQRREYVFQLRGADLFMLEPHWRYNQPGCGMISFNINLYWEAPEYDLNHLLDIEDFDELYYDFLQNRFDDMDPDPNDKAFQYFVLFQFEIARRVRNEHQGIPTRVQTEDAIDMALKLGTVAVYTKLMEMFRAKYWGRNSQRIIAYDNLQRIYEEEELAQRMMGLWV